MQGRTVVCWWQFWFIFPFSLVEIRYNSMFLATISSNLVGRNHIPVPWGPAFRDGSRCSHVQPRWSVATWPGHCPRKSSSGRKMAHVPRMMEVEGTWYTVIHIGFQWFPMVFNGFQLQRLWFQAFSSSRYGDLKRWFSSDFWATRRCIGRNMGCMGGDAKNNPPEKPTLPTCL